MPACGDVDVRPVRIAIQLQPQRCSFAELRRAAASFEELGNDMLLTWDHFFPMYGPENDRTYECWTTLASWAEVTTTGRGPAEIERSTRILNSTPDEDGEALTAIGTRLFTLVGRPPDFDAALPKDWLAFRDDFNSSFVHPVGAGEERRGPT